MNLLMVLKHSAIYMKFLTSYSLLKQNVVSNSDMINPNCVITIWLSPAMNPNNTYWKIFPKEYSNIV